MCCPATCRAFLFLCCRLTCHPSAHTLMHTTAHPPIPVLCRRGVAGFVEGRVAGVAGIAGKSFFQNNFVYRTKMLFDVVLNTPKQPNPNTDQHHPTSSAKLRVGRYQFFLGVGWHNKFRRDVETRFGDIDGVVLMHQICRCFAWIPAERRGQAAYNQVMLRKS